MKNSVKAVILALAAACGGTSSANVEGSAALAKSDNSNFVYPKNPLYQQVTLDQSQPDSARCRFGTTIYPCNTPSSIRGAYDVPSTLDGSGQTIVIVDAYGSPTIQQDLKTFDAIFGLPDPPSFTIDCGTGCSQKKGTGWDLETSLDVEYAHAIAPGANIVLVVASTAYGDSINAAEAHAIKAYGAGAIMSQSFGIPEILIHGDNAQVMQASKNYEAANAANWSVFASSGDSGATNGYAVANAGFPASHPLVTGVGGTMGNPYACGLSTPCGGPGPFTYGGEQVWNEPQYFAAGGGAPSFFFAAPSFQSALGLTARTVPDVSYNASIIGGVLVVDGPYIYMVGGTSAGSPQWAGIAALANQANHGPLGFLTPKLYALAGTAAFHDITVGNNQQNGTPVGYNAGPGYDFATGIGTPDVAKLIHGLVPSWP